MAIKLEDLQKQLEQVMEDNKKLRAELEASNAAKSAQEQAGKARQGKSVVLISISKARNFMVDPSKVIKVHKGTEEVSMLKEKVLIVGPGNIIEVTPEFSDFLLSFKKDFQKYHAIAI